MKIGWIALALALPGSAALADEPTLPVIAVLGDRVLVGTATMPEANGRSVFRIQTEKPGVDWIGCMGAFAPNGPGGGPVSAECSNGEKLIGDFTVLDDTRGYGAFPARPDHVPFRFTFGLELKEALKYVRLPAGQTLVQGADGKIDFAPK